jgi:hypothetical protein
LFCFQHFSKIKLKLKKFRIKNKTKGLRSQIIRLTTSILPNEELDERRRRKKANVNF